jgi:hypothetical protein
MPKNRNRNKKTASGGKVNITRRITNSKRHTIGYVVGGKELSVDGTRSLVARNLVNGVRLVGNHIQALPGRRRLSDLPTKVQKAN